MVLLAKSIEGILAFAAILERHIFVQDFFATALMCEGASEGEARHPHLTWRMAKQSLN